MTEDGRFGKVAVGPPGLMREGIPEDRPADRVGGGRAWAERNRGGHRWTERMIRWVGAGLGGATLARIWPCEILRNHRASGDGIVSEGEARRRN